jgi:general secretion pathway protein A
MTLEDAAAYIGHRLSVAGGAPDLFRMDAVALIHSSARGIPRLINQLCDLALVYGYAEQCTCIDRDLLERVLEDRQRRGAMPLFGTRTAAGNTSVGIG